MLRCTYIVLIHNDEDNIIDLVNSLKKIHGNFRKEFIFVDDGSTDESLNKLKIAVNDIPRTTIITQSNQGPSLSIDKALHLSTGEYIHFVEGNEILHPESTSLLLESCLSQGAEVAIGGIAKMPLQNKELSSKSSIILSPVEKILLNKQPNICRVGTSGSLVSKNLLDKVGHTDNSIYSQNMSLSLKCARNSKFVYIPSEITYISKDKVIGDKRFISYNRLKSVYNFVKSNQEFAHKLVPQLLKFLGSETESTKFKINYAIQSISSKYFKLIKLNNVLEAYKKEIDKLF